MTKLLRKFYEAKCVTPISIHGIGDCIVGKTYKLDEDQAKYNGGAFDLKNAKVTEDVVKMDDFGNDGDPVLTKTQLVEKEMEQHNAIALANEKAAAAELGMTLEQYREHAKASRKPIAEVVKDREGRGKQLAKMNKDPLIELANTLMLEVKDEDTREILIQKILDKEFPVVPTV